MPAPTSPARPSPVRRAASGGHRGRPAERVYFAGHCRYARRHLMGTPAPPDVRIAEVTKRFGDVVAVDNLSLEVPPRQLLRAAGPSGCGKTTTLRMIAGFEHPPRARSFIGDRDVTQVLPYPPRQHGLPELRAVPAPDVFETSPSGCASQGRRAEIEHPRRRDARAGRARRLPPTPPAVSGGQQQRVALARASSTGRRCCCSTSHWARSTSSCGADAARAEAHPARGGITFIHVTHDQEEAMTMAEPSR